MIVTPLGASLAGGIHRYIQCTHTHARTHVKKGGGVVDPDPRELQPDYFQLFSLTVR